MFMRLDIFFQFVLWFFNIMLTIWRLSIYWVNRILLYGEYGGRPSHHLYHKVLLLGDGIVQGFGASITTGSPHGLVRKLNQHYHRLPNIKTRWVFFERGSLNSRTEDWLPEGKLLDRIMAGKAARDVDIVVLVIGIQDLLSQTGPSQLLDNLAQAASKEVELSMVSNIRATVQALLEKGLYVAVCSLPLVGEPTAIRGKTIGHVNRQLKSMVERLNNRKASYVDISTRRICRAEYRSYDGIHFNSQGYDAIGEAILDVIGNWLVQVEFQAFQPYLQGKKTMPAPEDGWLTKIASMSRSTRSQRVKKEL